MWENPGASVMCLFSFGWLEQTGQEQSLNQITPEFQLLIFPPTYCCCPAGAVSYIEKTFPLRDVLVQKLPPCVKSFGMGLDPWGNPRCN